MGKSFDKNIQLISEVIIERKKFNSIGCHRQETKRK